MLKDKLTPGDRAKKHTAASLLRSSAAEYLTFVAASGTGGVEAVYADGNVWLTQKMMSLLYDVDVRTISYHLKNVFADHELEENSVIQFFRITAADGKSCRMPAKFLPKSPRSTPKASSKNIASCRTGCSSRTLTG